MIKGFDSHPNFHLFLLSNLLEVLKDGPLLQCSSYSHIFTWLDVNLTPCMMSFHFLIAFFQLLKDLEIHISPVLWRDIPLFLQTLQKASWKLSWYISQVKLSCHFFLYFVDSSDFFRCFTVKPEHCFFAGPGSKVSVSESLLLISSSLLLVTSVDFEELAPKEWISFRYHQL